MRLCECLCVCLQVAKEAGGGEASAYSRAVGNRER